MKIKFLFSMLLVGSLLFLFSACNKDTPEKEIEIEKEFEALPNGMLPPEATHLFATSDSPKAKPRNNNGCVDVDLSNYTEQGVSLSAPGGSLRFFLSSSFFECGVGFFGSTPFAGPPLHIGFSNPVSEVYLGAGDFGADQDIITATAYDAGGNVLTSETQTLGGGVFGCLSFSLSAPGITLVVVTSSGEVSNSVYVGAISYCADSDGDGDGIPDSEDNCPTVPNADQADNDGDGEGDACDVDDDNDGVNDDVDNCPFDANANQANYDGDSEGDVCDTDDDNDGFTDDVDLNPRSNQDATVIIDGCDSGVTNEQIANGSNMSDLIGDCVANARNHGAFVRCVSGLTNQWKRDGLISGREKGAIQRCAARANLP